MRRRASGFLLGVALLAAAVLPASAAPKPYDQMAPENTTLFVNVRNVSDYLKRLEASPLGEAWNSEDMKPFVDQMMNNRIAVRLVPTRTRSWDHRKLGMGEMPVSGSTAQYLR